MLMNRATLLARVFFLSFFSFLTVLLGIVLLVTLPQVRETVEAFEGLTQVVFFLVAEFYWALCAWLCARFVLERRYAPFEPMLPCSHPRFAARVIAWTPRAVGLTATLTLAVSMFFRPSEELPVSWLLPAAVAVLFLVFVVYRRRFFPALVKYEPPDPGYTYQRFSSITWSGWALLWVLALVPVSVFVALFFGPRVVSRLIGTPALALFALGSWNLSGGFGLIYWPLSRGGAARTIYPVIAAAVFSAWVENHNTPIGPRPQADALRGQDPRLTLEAHWAAWLAELEKGPCGGQHPIYLVAAAGGASRAAYWTGLVLSDLEDGARAAAGQPDRACFARNIFALSGVSGGSLGAATLVSLLADEMASKAPAPRLRPAATDFLKKDMLAPLAGYFLYADLVQRFLPFAVTTFDRSRGLELTWTDDWQDRAAESASPIPNWFALQMDALYEGRRAALPSLILNTTRVSDGRRALQSNIRFAPDDMYDLFSEKMLTGRLTLAGAVHNSSRFSYVSPVARAWTLYTDRTNPEAKAEVKPWGYLVDGGYFENSGAATLAEVIRKAPEAVRKRLTLILTSSEPSDGRKDYICSDGPIPAPSTPPKASPFAMELIAPPLALYSARTARAHAADMTAARLLADDGGGFSRVFELRLPLVKGHVPPMTWYVSERGATAMNLFVDAPPTTDGGRLGKNLKALRDLVATGGSPSAGAPCTGLMGPAPVLSATAE